MMIMIKVIIIKIMSIMMIKIILIMIQVLFVWGHSEHGKSDGKQRSPLPDPPQPGLTAGAGSQRHRQR